jgi:hypothetical protein
MVPGSSMAHSLDPENNDSISSHNNSLRKLRS